MESSVPCTLTGVFHELPRAAGPNGHIGLIHAPGFVRRLQMWSCPLLEFRGIVLNPSPARRMGDLQAAFDQQFLDITVRKGVAKVPANGTENDLRSEVPPLEDRWTLGLSYDRSSVAVLLPAGFATHPSLESPLPLHILGPVSKPPR